MAANVPDNQHVEEPESFRSGPFVANDGQSYWLCPICDESRDAALYHCTTEWLEGGPDASDGQAYDFDVARNQAGNSPNQCLCAVWGHLSCERMTCWVLYDVKCRWSSQSRASATVLDLYQAPLWLPTHTRGFVH